LRFNADGPAGGAATRGLLTVPVGLTASMLTPPP
jgi:hypothetical protein